MPTDLEYRVRIRNAANSADTLVVTSTRGGTNPYITAAPSGDAQKINPRTGESYFGVYSIRLADVDIGSSQRLLTSILEDAGQRQQLGYRTAFIEYRENAGSWQVLIAGPITGLRLVSDIEWEVTVSDPMQAQTVKRIFTASDDTLITDFLDSWPLRGCLLGGPVKGATPPTMAIADLGGWEMQVDTTSIGLGTGEYWLRPVHVYGPPTWRNSEDHESLEEIARAVNDAASTLQSEAISSAADSFDTIKDAFTHAYSHPGLVILIDDVPWKPLIFDYEKAQDSEGVTVYAQLFGYGYRYGQRGLKVKSDGVKTLTNGQRVRVRALTVLPSELCPIYIVDHPVEILKALWTSAGIAYSSSDCDALKELIGTDARFGLRITSSEPCSAVANRVCFPYGIGLRGNGSGQIVPFDARLGRDATAPAVTITDADVEKGSVRAFDLDPGAAVTLINFRAQLWIDQRSVPIRIGIADLRNGGPFGGLQTSIVDGIVVSETRLTVENSESGALSFGDIEMAFDGVIMGARSKYVQARDFFINIARRVFDRWGRGSQGAAMTFLRTGAGANVQVGQEVLIDVSALPNHNYRLGDNGAISARAMQVVQRTVVPRGLQVTLEDSGLSGQPPGTLPVVSIAASSDMPRTVALGTITNAATLNAAGYGVRVQMAFGATTTRYFDVIIFPPGEVPTAAFRLPPVHAATDVYMRARSEVPGSRPSNWSGGVSVTLSGVAAPTSVVATPNATDGGKCDLTWVVGGTAEWIDVYIRLDGEPDDRAVRLATLEPGSDRYEISGLQTGTDYVASVRHRHPNTQDRSALVDASFTTVGTTVTLSAPADPCPFASAPSLPRLMGSLLAKIGLYGIAVVAAEYPGEIEVYEAVETGVGAGTYGSFGLVGTVSSVSGNWTLWQRLAPNDGFRRQLKARHIRTGAFASAYCATVTATPWTYQALAAYPGNALIELAVKPLTPSASDRLAFRLTPRDPFPSGSSDISLAFDIESGLTVYEYGTTTPASTVSVQSSSDNDYEAIRPEATAGAKTVSATATKAGRTTGPSAIVVVPEKSSTTLPSVPTITAIRTSNLNAPNPPDGGGSFDIDFDAVNMPAGTTFDLAFEITAGTVGGGPFNDTRTGISNPDTIDCASVGGLDGSAVPAAKLILQAKVLGNVIATGVYDSTLNP